MSYYSDVAFILYKEDHEELKKIGSDLKMDDRPFFMLYPDKLIDFIVEDKRYVFCEYDCIKYYKEREDVKAFKDFLSKHSHSFVRLGETIDDTETDFEYGSDYVFERLSVKQEIDF